MTSDINEIIAPVIEQLRNPDSPVVSKPTAEGMADAVQENNAVKPSPGDKNRVEEDNGNGCLLYTSPSPRDATLSRMPSSA